jgi:hypothetical protein
MLPIVAGFFLWVLLSSFLLTMAEQSSNNRIASYGDALFYTSMALFGENFEPVTGKGRVLNVSDSLSGFLLLGIIIWIVTFSAERDEERVAKDVWIERTVGVNPRSVDHRIANKRRSRTARRSRRYPQSTE